MSDKEGVSRRSILGAVLDKSLSQDLLISRAIDVMVPESIPQVRRLRELQELPGEVPNKQVAEAIGGLVKLYPVVYELDSLGMGMNYSHGSIMLPLGPIDLRLTHTNWHGIYNGLQEASVVFNPTDRSVDEVTFIFDSEDDESGRSDIGAFDDFRPVIEMNLIEENLYIEELEAQGFYNYDVRVVLEAIHQAVVHGERSRYWEEVARPSLQIEELSAFNISWFRELLSNRGIDPELFEAVSRQLPIRESIDLVKKADKLSRIDLMRMAARKGTTIVRDIFNPREKAVIPGFNEVEQGHAEDPDELDG